MIYLSAFFVQMGISISYLPEVDFLGKNFSLHGYT